MSIFCSLGSPSSASLHQFPSQGNMDGRNDIAAPMKFFVGMDFDCKFLSGLRCNPAFVALCPQCPMSPSTRLAGTRATHISFVWPRSCKSPSFCVKWMVTRPLPLRGSTGLDPGSAQRALPGPSWPFPRSHFPFPAP